MKVQIKRTKVQHGIKIVKEGDKYKGAGHAEFAEGAEKKESCNRLTSAYPALPACFFIFKIQNKKDT